MGEPVVGSLATAAATAVLPSLSEAVAPTVGSVALHTVLTSVRAGTRGVEAASPVQLAEMLLRHHTQQPRAPPLSALGALGTARVITSLLMRLQPGAVSADLYRQYLECVAIPALKHREDANAPPPSRGMYTAQREMCHALATLGRMFAGDNPVVEATMLNCCVRGLNLSESRQAADLPLEAACFLASSICSGGAGQRGHGGLAAAMRDALLPRIFDVLGDSERATVKERACIICELLPSLMGSAPPPVVDRLRTIFVELISVAGPLCSTGLQLGCQFTALLVAPSSGWSVPDEFWPAIRCCLSAGNDIDRKRALHILAIATGATDTLAELLPPSVALAAGKPKGKKNSGARRAKDKLPVDRTSIFWLEFMRLYVAVETNTGAMATSWADAVEQLRSCRPDPSTCTKISLDTCAEPWVQLLLLMSFRHSNTAIQRIALRLTLEGRALGPHHTLLVNGDDFVLSFCSLISTPVFAVDMLFDDIRAVCSPLPTSATRLFGLLNRQVAASSQFLSRWVHWLASQFSPHMQMAVLLIRPLLHLWLHWFVSLDVTGAELGHVEISSLASLVAQWISHGLWNNAGMLEFMRCGVGSAAARLCQHTAHPLRVLAPVLEWIPLHALNCSQTGHGPLLLEHVSTFDDSVKEVKYAVLRFLKYGTLPTDDDAFNGITSAKPRCIALMLCLLAESGVEASETVYDCIAPVFRAIERAHTHLYQSFEILDHAVLIVDALTTTALSAPAMQTILQEWLSNSGVVPAVVDTVESVLTRWLLVESSSTCSASHQHNARMAQADRIARLQQDAIELIERAVPFLRVLDCVEELSLPGEHAASIAAMRLINGLFSTGQMNSYTLQRVYVTLENLQRCLLYACTSSCVWPFDETLSSMLRVNDLCGQAEWLPEAWLGSLACILDIQRSNELLQDPPSEMVEMLLTTVIDVIDSLSRSMTNDMARRLKYRNAFQAMDMVLTWLAGLEKSKMSSPKTVQLAMEMLRAGYNVCAHTFQGSVSQTNLLTTQSRMLIAISPLLHPWPFSQMELQGPILGKLLGDVFSMCKNNSDWAPICALQCAKLWLRYPAVAMANVMTVCNLCCYIGDATCIDSDQEGQSDDLGRQQLNELLTRSCMLVYVQRVAQTAQACDENTANIKPPLFEVLIRALIGKMLSLHGHESNDARCSMRRHKLYVALGQSLCVTVGYVRPGTELAQFVHDQIVDMMMRELFPVERQYLDLVLIRLLDQCPQLIERWLTPAITNYTLAPQILTSLVLVAGTILLRCDTGDRHLKYFNQLFPAIVSWVNSGHRQLRSLSQVYTQKLMDDCTTRLGSVVAADDMAAYKAIANDDHLQCLRNYLRVAAEGLWFRRNLSESIVGFVQALEKWCEPMNLVGRDNYVDGDGTHGDRTFAPSSRSTAVETGKLTPEMMHGTFWIPEAVYAEISSCILQSPLGTIDALPWADMVLGLGRIAPIPLPPDPGVRSRQLTIVASFVDKTPNIAGLCRTCDLLGGGRPAACDLIVQDMSALEAPRFEEISHGAEQRIIIAAISQEWVLAFLKEQRRRGCDIIAVEQTSSSVSLESFVWPKRSILLLGKEKEGVPVELLREATTCLEIPQFGVLRSLNVHVSGAIVAWECLQAQSSK